MDQSFRLFYPFESHWYDRDGLRMHYLDEGQGDPIVMLHGNPTWSFYYREVVKAVRTDYRAIVPDHIGMGLSDKPDDSQYFYTVVSRIDDLDRLLAHMGVTENITLLLHDWGGMIGLGYARRRPDRIKRIALLNTAAFLPEKITLPAPLWLSGRTLIGSYLVRSLNAFARGATAMAAEHPIPTAIADAYCAPYDSWANRIATLRFVQDIPTNATHPAWPTFAAGRRALEGGLFADIPAAIFWGMKDFVFNGQFLDHWTEYWPQAEVHRYEGAGHYVLEDESEDIISRFLDFLERHPLHSDTSA